MRNFRRLLRQILIKRTAIVLVVAFVAQLAVLSAAGLKIALDMRSVRNAFAQKDAQSISRSTASAASATEIAASIARFPPLGVLSLAPKIGARFNDAVDAAPAAAATLDLASRLFSGDRPRTWLVGLQNPAEMRATGGLIGSWVTVSTGDDETGDGMPDLLEVQRISALFQASSALPTEQRGTLNINEQLYRTFSSRARIQNINVVPDFPKVARELVRAYDKALLIEKSPELSGVILLDTAALEMLLQISGPIRVTGVDGLVSASNVEDIVLARLYVTHPVEADRVAVLHELVTTLWGQLFKGDVTPSKAILGEALRTIRDGHLQMWAREHDLQQLIQEIGIDGSWPQPTPLSFGIVGQNAAANKLDQMLTRRVTVGSASVNQRTEMNLTIALKNNAPASGLPQYVLGPYETMVGILKPGDNRQAYTIYTSLPWTRITVNGKKTTALSMRDGEWWVTFLVVNVPQGGSTTIELTAQGNGNLSADQLDIWSSVNISSTKLQCEHDGRAVEPLTSDQMFRHGACPV